MVSFDVVSLFTNIPHQLVIRSIIFRWDSIKEKTNVNLDLFLEMVDFCLRSSYFRFRDKFYSQLSGTAMGSPLSPILADMVMEDLLSSVTAKLTYVIPVLKKYVDDLFLALPRNQVQSTLQAFNDYDPHLQFTMEEEKDGSLPYLDTKVFRNNNQTLSTKWYAKPIASGRILNYLSFHPLSMKVNVATNFIHRVTSLTSNTNTSQIKPIIFQYLRQNNYPSTLINRLINRNTNTPNQQTAITSRNDQSQAANDVVYKSMPNIPQLSTTIRSILRKDYPSVQVALRSLKTTNSLLRPVKDPIDPQQQYNIIYSIPCTECRMVYIGMTRNQLKTRLSGHQSNINKCASTNMLADNNERTALIQHIMDTQHNFNLKETKIIDRSFRSSALPILEMCHITNTPNTVNYRTDVDNLNTAYAGILHTYKNTLSRRSQNSIAQTTTNTVRNSPTNSTQSALPSQ